MADPANPVQIDGFSVAEAYGSKNYISQAHFADGAVYGTVKDSNGYTTHIFRYAEGHLETGLLCESGCYATLYDTILFAEMERETAEGGWADRLAVIDASSPAALRTLSALDPDRLPENWHLAGYMTDPLALYIAYDDQAGESVRWQKVTVDDEWQLALADEPPVPVTSVKLDCVAASRNSPGPPSCSDEEPTRAVTWADHAVFTDLLAGQDWPNCRRGWDVTPQPVTRAGVTYTVDEAGFLHVRGADGVAHPSLSLADYNAPDARYALALDEDRLYAVPETGQTILMFDVSVAAAPAEPVSFTTRYELDDLSCATAFDDLLLLVEGSTLIVYEASDLPHQLPTEMVYDELPSDSSFRWSSETRFVGSCVYDGSWFRLKPLQGRFPHLPELCS